MARVLVTGGAGFVGSHLVRALLSRGDEVVVIDNFETGQRENLEGLPRPIRLVEGSIADPAAVDEALDGVELVLHQAALPSVPKSVERPLDTHEANIVGTLQLLEGCRRAGVRRLVYAASSSAYGDHDADRKHEALEPRPKSPYAVQKLCGEHYVRVWGPLYGMETVALRFFNVFGPRQDPSSPYSGVVSLFLDALRAGRTCTLHGGGDQTRDFIAVADVVRAVVLAGTAAVASGSVCNVARGEGTSVRALHDCLARLLGVDATPTVTPARDGDIKHSVARVQRAAELLGFRAALSVPEGLAALL